MQHSSSMTVYRLNLIFMVDEFDFGEAWFNKKIVNFIYYVEMKSTPDLRVIRYVHIVSIRITFSCNQ